MIHLSPYGRKGPLVRVAYLGLSLIVWALTGFGRFSGGRTVTLCYHSVRDQERAAFGRQLRRMRKRLVPTASLPGRRGLRPGPPRVALTFDDAFACLLPNVLEASGASAAPLTIYAVSGCLGRSPSWSIPDGHPEASLPTMTGDELRRAAATPGVTIGSHTVRHPRLDKVGAERLDEELASSRRDLEALLERPVEELALPHGAWDERTVEAARRAGYRRVLTLEPVMAPSGLPSPLAGRFLMSPDAWGLEFLLTIDGAYRWLPAVRAIARRLRRGRRETAARSTGDARVAG